MIAWALHHRRWMGAIAFASFVGAIALHANFGGTSFLPSSDSGNLVINIRTPSSSSLEYSRVKVEAAAKIAHELKENGCHQFEH